MRVRFPGVVPLEIWDHPVGDRRLSDDLDAPGLAERLAPVLAELPAARGFRQLFVGGGRATPWLGLPGAHRLGGFPGAAGGLALLAGRGLAGAVVDLGQTSVKIATASTRVRLPRAGRSARQLLAAAFHRVAGAGAVVVALPAALDDDGTPGPSTYPDLDRHLVDEALAAAGLAVPRFVCNDAELAALSAKLHPARDRDTLALVITLGFGVGAALVTPVSTCQLEFCTTP